MEKITEYLIQSTVKYFRSEGLGRDRDVADVWHR